MKSTGYLAVDPFGSADDPVVDNNLISGQVYFCNHPVIAVVNRNFVRQGVEGQEDSLDRTELSLLGHHAQGGTEVLTLVFCDIGLAIFRIQN